MANYIKSHSNWVLQSKHQDINDGTIYERDITTIGGVSDFPNGQTPIYRSNNFIVSIRNGSKQSNQYNTNKWEENNVSGTVWNLQSISGLSSDSFEDNDTKIVLKQDYYDLSDFAYYGSLTELFRASVTDILDRFPGEMYITDRNVYYTSSYTEDFERVEESIILGGEEYYEVSNPFGIDLHSTIVPNGANPLKYLNANNGYKNYIVGYGDYVGTDIASYFITAPSNETSPEGGDVNFTATKVSTNLEINGIDIAFKEEQKGERIFTINVYVNGCLSGDCSCNGYMFDPTVIDSESPFSGGSVDYGKTLIPSDGFTIFGYIGDDCKIVYLSKYKGLHIRPKKEFIDKFYNECDNFEKLLMNRDADYKAVFSVIRENDYGYYRELVPFQFPKGDGGYNIDATEYGFNAYTEQMIKIGEYYDEYFTDNLWRSMTHEAIKNFDWTYTREFQEGDEEEYVFGGQRIQKALRIFAREFDEILSYINNIKSINRVTYDERSNIPDYFLPDVVGNEGWDVKLIYPYNLIEKDTNGNLIEWNQYKEGGGINCLGQLNNTNNSGDTIVREFSQNSNLTVIPYTNTSSYEYGYFDICSSDTRVSAFSSIDTIRYDGDALGGKGVLKRVIKNYTNYTKWSYQKVNNEFLKRLKINSPYIWRHKGTIEGIEMILGMFGMKSKRWVGDDDRSKYDYEVTEYTSFAHRIEEPWDAVHQDYRINWVNSTKTIAYDNRSISNYNKFGIEPTRIPYQGIPVAYRNEYPSDTAYIGKTSLYDQLTNGITPSSSANCFTREDGTPVLRRFLYPNFNAHEEMDGNPYFQMNGGWLSKVINNDIYSWNFQFDTNNNIVYSVNGVDEMLYKETVRNIQRLDNINDLLSIPSDKLRNGIICNVTKIEEKAAVIDGLVYPILSEWYGEGNSAHTVDYVSFVKTDGYISVGTDKYFDSTIIVYNNEGVETVFSIDDKNDGYEVKAYLNGNSFICKEDSDGNYSISSFVRLDTEWVNGVYTNYFLLDDVNYASEIAKWDDDISGFTSGWKRLTTDDSNYIKINTIINYNKGNNPHNGNMVYDNGHEYLTYFKRIFKYAADNELFDSRCYDDFYASLDDEIYKYGFNGLVNKDENIKRYDEFLIKDSKIHYFGNYRDNKKHVLVEKNIDCDENEITARYSKETRIIVPTNISCEETYVEAKAVEGDRVWIYGQDTNRINGYKNVYSDKVEGYILNDKNAMIGGTPYPQSNDVDEVTNQIVNNKRLNINFNLHSEWFTNQGQCELKYIDDIVMNYLTQMIPSSTILQITYTSK